jgi:hypothetical protein
MDKPTEKQRRFVEAYMGEAAGNATEAASLAGYAGNRKTLEAVGRENLAKPRIAQMILQAQQSDPLIATREDRQRFWTRVMMGLEPDVRMADRLKASELLGKASADFIERHEVNAKVTDGYSFGVTRPKADAEAHQSRTH